MSKKETEPAKSFTRLSQSEVRQHPLKAKLNRKNIIELKTLRDIVPVIPVQEVGLFTLTGAL